MNQPVFARNMMHTLIAALFASASAASIAAPTISRLTPPSNAIVAGVLLPSLWSAVAVRMCTPTVEFE